MLETAATPAEPGTLFRGILFDMDGVVVHSEPLHEEAMRAVFHRMDLVVPESRFREFKGTAEKDLFDLVAREYSGGRFEGAEIYAAKQEAFEIGLPRVPIVKGLASYGKELHRLGIPAALVTSASRHNCDLVLRLPTISFAFAATVTADDVVRTKPHPEPYLAGAEALGLDPADCLVIEDAERGVEAALAAGCRVAGLATTLAPEDLAAAGCEWVATDFDDLRRVMNWPGPAART